MRKLNLSEWANIAEILASVVIVFSLAYVGLELNQNTKALQHDSYQSVLDSLAEGDLARAMDAELDQIILTGELAPNELGSQEWSRFTSFAFPRMGLYEYMYLAKQQDALSDVQWSAFEPYFSSLVCLPGYEKFLNENKLFYAELFMAYLTQDIISQCGSD